MVNFPTRIPDCDSHSPALLDLFISSDFPSYSQRHASFHRISCDCSRADWDGLRASAAASEFCEWFQVGIDVYIPHRNCQVNAHSSPWFSAACAAAIVHRNHFFRLHQKDQSSESKVKFRQASSNHCKRFLKLPNLHMLIKQKSPSLSGNLARGAFGELPIVFSTKVNLLYLFYSTARRCCLLHLTKQNYLLKTFLRTLILMTQVSLYLISLQEPIRNCIIFL